MVWKISRQEAAEYDKQVIGVLKSDGKLVGHMLIELWNLIHYFLWNSEENRVSTVAAGQGKRENGLVVPAEYSAFTKGTKNATILQQEILRKKSRYSHFELDFSLEKLVKPPMLRKE